MARPRKQTYTMSQYLEKNMDGDISNDADTQRNPAWKAIFNGLMVTVLTDDYIPSIILAEEDNSQLHIVDGGSRTAALNMFRYGNWKISSSVENSVIPYKKKTKSEDGDVIWENAEFNIKNKTYDQLPAELKKKFDEYQIETVIHEHCDKAKIAMYIKRYNEHSAMNTNQKMFIYIPNYAGKIRKIINRPFFLNYSDYKDTEKEKGVLERVVMESVMCMFHLDDWNKQGKKISSYLNEKSSETEFDRLNGNLERLEKVITDDTKEIFNSKDSLVWLTLFDRFTDLGVEDSKFESFIRAFKSELKNKPVKGRLFDNVDETGSTKDKSVLTTKLQILESLMREYLDVGDEDKETDPEMIISDIVGIDKEILHEDMDFYNEALDKLTSETIKDGSKLLDEKNRLSLLAMMVYSYKEDKDLDKWMLEYAKKNNTYFVDQRKNFTYMKQDLEKYIQKGKVA